MWSWFRKWLFAFDAESVHHFTSCVVRFLGRVCPSLLRRIAGLPSSQPHAVRVFDLSFASPLGLAAGFDKNAELLPYLPHLGFGFAEIGTVTPRPQAGNPKPRLFRHASTQVLYNRMGFNNDGAQVVAARVRSAKPCLPENFRVGINIGKNKDTPLTRAAEDYSEAAKAFESLADYLVVNVSSPNTPNLRSLQDAEALHPILEALRSVTASWEVKPPILVKLAPELFLMPTEDLWKDLKSLPADGYVLTNTLASEWRGKPAGCSGQALQEISRKALQDAKTHLSVPIISVGGISSVDEAQERLKLGADLIQIYTGWIYQGPRFPSKILKSLGELNIGGSSRSDR